MKKKINSQAILNELQGSVFFPSKKEAPPQQDETSLQQETSLLVNKQTSKLVYQETSKRVTYPKVTFQLHPDIIDTLEEAKRTLRKNYRLKASLVEIVEEGIRQMCQDLDQNKDTSKLVNLFTRKQDNKETRKQGF